MNEKFDTKIGLEIHVQLKTKSKMFCGCDNDAQGKAPNTVVCPICMGMPGTLPVANKKAIEMTVKTGLALGSKIPKVSKFDRKHYFYPDLPKGYQISQFDQPFCVGGTLEIGGETIRFNRIHLEEDAGKLVHPKESKDSVVDLNRAGTPLMEIVTEPDIKSATQAKEFLKKLQEILRHLDVSDADMEKGHLRCDANISVKIKNKEKMSEIVEIKNVNSFKFVEKALSLEQERLIDQFPDWPDKEKKVTRGYDSSANKTFVQREKEEAKDYRYFPEPDLPPFEFSNEQIESIAKDLPLLPEQGRQKYQQLGISDDYIRIILKNKEWKTFLDRLIELDDQFAPQYSRLIVNEPLSRDKSPDFILKLVKLTKEKNLTSNLVRKILKTDSFGEEENTKENYQKGLDETVKEILRKNPEACEKYLAGKTQVLGFLVGQVMKASGGKFNAAVIQDKIIKMIGKN